MTALVSFANGKPFAVGAVGYNSNPGTGTWSRIIVDIKIGSIETTAMVDTAAPYMICQRELAESLGLEYSKNGQTDTVNIRGTPVEGSLHRIPLSFLAEEGQDVTIETSVFVPRDVELPTSFVGLASCLESIFFAIDPMNEVFYFGPQS